MRTPKMARRRKKRRKKRWLRSPYETRVLIIRDQSDEMVEAAIAEMVAADWSIEAMSAERIAFSRPQEDNCASCKRPESDCHCVCCDDCKKEGLPRAEAVQYWRDQPDLYLCITCANRLFYHLRAQIEDVKAEGHTIKDIWVFNEDRDEQGRRCGAHGMSVVQFADGGHIFDDDRCWCVGFERNHISEERHPNGAPFVHMTDYLNDDACAALKTLPDHPNDYAPLQEALRADE